MLSLISRWSTGCKREGFPKHAVNTSLYARLRHPWLRTVLESPPFHTLQTIGVIRRLDGSTRTFTASMANPAAPGPRPPHRFPQPIPGDIAGMPGGSRFRSGTGESGVLHVHKAAVRR